MCILEESLNFDKLKFHSGEETGSDKDARKIDFIDHQKFLMKDEILFQHALFHKEKY
jgi:hypothetical protein